MIGAMPAVAVRHERRRQEKRNKRPSMLYLQSPLSRSPTPSPLQSPPPGSAPTSQHQPQPTPELYLCARVSVLHVVVVSLLLSAVLLIVGLVQLKPGADASQHRYVLLAGGGLCLMVGVILAVVRCCLLPWQRPPPAPPDPEVPPEPPAAPPRYRHSIAALPPPPAPSDHPLLLKYKRGSVANFPDLSPHHTT